MLESRRANESDKKASSRENGIGLRVKCTGCCYDAFSDKI